MTMFDAVSDTMRKDLVDFYSKYIVYGHTTRIKNRADYLYNGSISLIDKIDSDLNEPISFLQNFTNAHYPGKIKPTKYAARKMLEKLLHLSYAVKTIQKGETTCN